MTQNLSRRPQVGHWTRDGWCGIWSSQSHILRLHSLGGVTVSSKDLIELRNKNETCASASHRSCTHWRPPSSRRLNLPRTRRTGTGDSTNLRWSDAYGTGRGSYDTKRVVSRFPNGGLEKAYVPWADSTSEAQSERRESGWEYCTRR